MEIVLLTALGVGGATVIGAAIGFAFKNISHKFSDVVLSFAAGVIAYLHTVANHIIFFHFKISPSVFRLGRLYYNSRQMSMWF